MVLAALAFTVWLQTRPPKWDKVTLTPVIQRVLTDDASPRLGATQPEVKIIVFTDYQCAICKRTDPALERLAATDPGVLIIFKDWPILGPASVEAAEVALAAAEQSKYLEVHRALMANRTKLDAPQIYRIAVAAGADGPRLVADRAAKGAAIKAQLAANASQAWSLGLPGTPGYLVGPYLIRGGLDDRALRRAVAMARKAGPPRQSP